MKRITVTPSEGFDIVANTPRSQAATMVLAPGTSTGGPDNKHPESDQWMYVLGGRGHATVAGERLELAPGALLLIEAGETHQIDNDGDDPLETLNVYAPKAY
jgi:mannose-6-phosphate isomerase-like protein (cupin superfamily)